MLSKSSPPADRGCFFIIGAQRSGTTYLYDLLAEHPQVAMAIPKRPEPKWFLSPEKAALGAGAWRKTLFPGVAGKLLGEKGTSYIEHPEAAASILNVFPEARFVAILREPVARAISNYRFSVDNGAESLPIEQALTPEAQQRPYDRQKISASPFIYLKRGCYAEYLAPWASQLPKDRLHVVLFEEITAEEGPYAGLCRFLGLEPIKPQGMGRVVNAAKEPMPEIPAQLKARLKEYFREPNERLEHFLQRPLGVWKA